MPSERPRRWKTRECACKRPPSPQFPDKRQKQRGTFSTRPFHNRADLALESLHGHARHARRSSVGKREFGSRIRDLAVSNGEFALPEAKNGQVAVGSLDKNNRAFA